MAQYILDIQAIEEDVAKKHHEHIIDGVMEVISKYYICMLKTHIYGFNNGIISKSTIACAQVVMDSIRTDNDIVVPDRRIAYMTFLNNMMMVRQYIDVVKDIETDAKGNIVNTSNIAKMRVSAEVLLSTIYRFIEYFYD